MAIHIFAVPLFIYRSIRTHQRKERIRRQSAKEYRARIDTHAIIFIYRAVGAQHLRFLLVPDARNVSRRIA